MRRSFVTLPAASSGTLKSTRTSPRLPRRFGRSLMVFFAMSPSRLLVDDLERLEKLLRLLAGHLVHRAGDARLVQPVAGHEHAEAQVVAFVLHREVAAGQGAQLALRVLDEGAVLLLELLVADLFEVRLRLARRHRVGRQVA